MPGKDGLLHISEMAHDRVRQVTDVIQVGDEVEVKVVGIDPTAARSGSRARP